jgi:hypothetical protein
MLCCLSSALMAGNMLAAGRIGFGLLRRPSVAAAMALAGIGALGIAVAPALAEHAAHYAARAEANHRSVLAEILAAPLCSGEAQS